MMLFAIALAALTVAGWAMTPRLRQLTNNSALGWLFHVLGIANVYMLAALTMVLNGAAVETLALYYDCLFVIGGATAIFFGIKLYFKSNVDAKGLEAKAS